jgi:hypothetical protein
MKPLMAFMVLVFALDCSAQSIADIARKERDRQKQVQSKVVITGGLTTTTTAGTASTGAAPASTPAPAVKSGELTDNKGRNEKFWRGAFQQARDNMARAEARIQLLDLKVKDLNTQLLRQDDIFNKEGRLGPEITTAQKELDDARKLADQAKQNLADLEDELRKSGGLAGWAR